jgi:hypothetical protein
MVLKLFKAEHMQYNGNNCRTQLINWFINIFDTVVTETVKPVITTSVYATLPNERQIFCVPNE